MRQIQIRIPDELVVRLDKMRGPLSRNEYARQALAERLGVELLPSRQYVVVNYDD